MGKKLFDHRLITTLCAIALAFVLGGCLWAFFELQGVGSAAGNSLILHFNDLSGITQIGGIAIIIFMGIFGVLVTFMNFFIALEFDSRPAKGRFFGRFLAAMTVVFAVLLFIAFAAIINVNV